MCSVKQTQPCFFIDHKDKSIVLLSSIDPATAATDESDPNEVTVLRSVRLETSAVQSRKPYLSKLCPPQEYSSPLVNMILLYRRTICLIFMGIIPFLFPVQ